MQVRVRKSSKENYQQLLSDIGETNRKASLVTFELGSLGHSLPTCYKSLRKTLPNICIFTRSDTCKLFDNTARIVISTFYTQFFLARKIYIGLQIDLYFHVDSNPIPIILYSFFLVFFPLFYYCLIVFLRLFCTTICILLPLPNSCLLYRSICMLILCPRTLSLISLSFFLSLFF